MTQATPGLLADGREIIFYDEHPTPRGIHDPRQLGARTNGSQLRLDPLSGQWTAIAAHRQDRTFLPLDDECPLCPSLGGRNTEIPAESYEVVVFENRFPSFDLGSSARESGGVHRSRGGRGRCEVVVFSSEHGGSFIQLSDARAEMVLRTFASRTATLAETSGIQYVHCFENCGTEIGVTLQHPHGQIYALPIVPPRIAALASAASDHRARTGECVQCTVLARELEEGMRVVVASEHFVAYVPFAARWPYEIRVVPRRHVPDLAHLGDAEFSDLARVFRDVLIRLDTLDPSAPVPYIAGWQQAPVGFGDDWHLAAEIFTIRRGPQRLKYLAGIESGTALWVNDIVPETAAKQLRKVRT